MPHVEATPFAKWWTFSEVAYSLGDTAWARRILEQQPPSPVASAMLALVDGSFERFGSTVRRGRLSCSSRPSRVFGTQSNSSPKAGLRKRAAELEQALAFYRPIGATLFVERGERLLAEAATG